MSTNVGDPTGAAQRSKPKGIDQATNPRWATAKIAVRGTIVVLSLAASITSLVYCRAPRRWDDWILLSPLYALPYVSPPTYMRRHAGLSNGSPVPGERGNGARLNGDNGAGDLNSRIKTNARTPRQPFLSLVWEVSEITVLFVRRDKNKGLIPAVHLAFELLLWLAGVILSVMWITSVTSTEQHSATFTEGSPGIPASTYKMWAHVIYFWCAVNLTTV